MFIRINNTTINYKKTGQGNPVVLLHGWKGNIKTLDLIHNHLEKNFKTFSIDLPGFGKSEEPKTVLNTKDYANILISLFERLKIENPILIGHSFGGKISIIISSLIPINKLILLNSSGIKPKLKSNYYFKVLPPKYAKKITSLILPKFISNNIIEFFKKRLGSVDYKQSSGIIREILIKTVNEDIRSFLPSIKAATILIWGENDTETPISAGELMEKLIINSKLFILKNAGHFAYLDKFSEFISILDDFLKEDKDKC